MQISEEEKKAIEIVKEIPHNHHEEIFMSEDLAIARVLNIIEKQQAEYSDLKLKYEQGLLLHKKHVSDLEIKDKMIYEMTEMFLTIAKDIPGTIYHYLEKDGFSLQQCLPCHKQEKDKNWTCAECFKEYFKRKAEDNE